MIETTLINTIFTVQPSSDRLVSIPIQKYPGPQSPVGLGPVPCGAGPRTIKPFGLGPQAHEVVLDLGP